MRFRYTEYLLNNMISLYIYKIRFFSYIYIYIYIYKFRFYRSTRLVLYIHKIRSLYIDDLLFIYIYIYIYILDLHRLPSGSAFLLAMLYMLCCFVLLFCKLFCTYSLDAFQYLFLKHIGCKPPEAVFRKPCILYTMLQRSANLKRLNVQYTVLSIQCSVYSVQCSVYSLENIVNIVFLRL